MLKVIFSILNFVFCISSVKCVDCNDLTFQTNIQMTSLPNNVIRQFPVHCMKPKTIANDVYKIKFMDRFTDVYENLVTGLPALKVIELVGIYVETLYPGAFKNLEKCHSIFLSNNRIMMVPNGFFSPIPSLLRLDLQHNQINTIEEQAFKNLNKLFYLNITDNNLESLPQNVFQDLPQLRYLSLRNNRLLRLEKYMFPDNIILYELLLSHNQLESLDENVFQYEGKKDNREIRIHLMDNNLSYLPMRLLRHFPKYEFDLRYNPWTCNCANEILRRVSKSGKVHLVMDEEPYCVSASTGNGSCEVIIDKEVISIYDDGFRKSNRKLISDANLASY